MNRKFEKACKIMGGRTAMKDALKVTRQAVSLWAKGIDKVPVKRVLQIEQLTGGQITRYDLRPDIYGKGNSS